MWVRGMSTREAYIWMYSVMRKYSAMLTHHKHDSTGLINNMGELPVLPSIRRYSHIRALKVYLLRLSMQSLFLGKFILPNFYEEEKSALFCYMPKVLLSCVQTINLLKHHQWAFICCLLPVFISSLNQKWKDSCYWDK